MTDKRGERRYGPPRVQPSVGINAKKKRDEEKRKKARAAQAARWAGMADLTNGQWDAIEDLRVAQTLKQRSPKFPRFKTLFNPPPVRYTTWGDRGRENHDERVKLKGFLRPDVSFALTDWDTQATADGAPPSSAAFDYTQQFYPFEMKNGFAVIYAFRFMYNPAVIKFGVNTMDGVNVGYIASGQGTAMPSGASGSGSTIEISFPISRVEDMAAIRSMPASGMVSNYPVPFGLQNKVDITDLNGIQNRGTMYDLEFLFRAVAGRRWKTFYRGQTADVGLAFGAPMVLDLAPEARDSMRYRVRVSNISFTHTSFTKEMIPIHTDVALSFERIPDVVGYA